MIEHSGCRWRIYGAWMVLVGKATAVQLLSEDDIRAEAAVESCFPAARLASDGCMSGQSGDSSGHDQRARPEVDLIQASQISALDDLSPVET